MKNYILIAGVVTLISAIVPLLHAASPEFTSIRQLTNREVAFTLAAPAGSARRVEVSTNVSDWSSLVTFSSTGTTLQHTDSAAPFLPERAYRAYAFSGTNVLDGDHLATTNGDVVIRPVNHASFVMQWEGKWIFNDPAVSAASTFPDADLVLISHSHGDHLNLTVLAGVTKTNSIIVIPPSLHSGMGGFQNRTVILPNGATTNVLGIGIEAVPAYNANHSPGTGNGYVLNIGGKRIYISGDTGDQPEIRALENIDVAFLCMNVPFTMTPQQATNSVRAFRPGVVYPYHYRNQNGTTTNAAYFKQILGTDSGIEVRLRNWY
ncbi:MAG TPA: MBL fold metallo-hydrolase [Verrucomicrobiae bacterium]|nr:MBL fold metallo-hydrolase [Verrucomicrobiae bacterium]